jgi:hypothetical protein
MYTTKIEIQDSREKDGIGYASDSPLFHRSIIINKYLHVEIRAKETR